MVECSLKEEITMEFDLELAWRIFTINSILAAKIVTVLVCVYMLLRVIDALAKWLWKE